MDMQTNQERSGLSRERIAFYKAKHDALSRDKRVRAQARRASESWREDVVEGPWTRRFHHAFPLSQIAVPLKMLTWKELWYRRFNPDEIGVLLHEFEDTVVPALLAAVSRMQRDGYPLAIDQGFTEEDIDALHPLAVPPFWEVPRTTDEEMKYYNRLEDLWYLFVEPVRAVTISWAAPGLYGISKDGRHRLMGAKLSPEEFATIPAWVHTPASLPLPEEPMAIFDEADTRSMWARLRARIQRE